MADTNYTFDITGNLAELAKIAQQYAQQTYEWALGEYDHTSAITDDAVNNFQNIANTAVGAANSDLGRYRDVFQPIEDQLVAASKSYASPGRMRYEMGAATSDAHQKAMQARANAIKNLQSYGIDPSAPRYAALDRQAQVDAAASEANAARSAAQNVQQVGRDLRDKAIAAGQRYPINAINELNTGVQGLTGAVNSTLANFKTGSDALRMPADYLAIAARLAAANASANGLHSSSGGGGGGGGARISGSDSDPFGQFARNNRAMNYTPPGYRPVHDVGMAYGLAQQAARGYDPSKQKDINITDAGLPVPVGTGPQPTGGANQILDAGGMPYNPNALPGFDPNAQNSAVQPYNLANPPLDTINTSLGRNVNWGNGQLGYDVLGGDWNQNFSGDYGLGLNVLPQLNGQFNYGGSGTGPEYDMTQPSFNTYDFGQNTNLWDQQGLHSGNAWEQPLSYDYNGAANPDYGSAFGGGQSLPPDYYSGSNGFNYSGPDYSPFNQAFNQPSTFQGWDQSSDYSGDTNFGGSDYSGGDLYNYNGDDGGYNYAGPDYSPFDQSFNQPNEDISGWDTFGASWAEGGAVGLPTTGGMVPQSASPSMGQQTDDVPASLNAGEFVIPKDVAYWKGQEFFQNLIEKSRQALSGAPAKGKPGMKASGPPTFKSQQTG